MMEENKRTKTIELVATSIFDAKKDTSIAGDLEVLMYEDGSVLFTGTSILENQEFIVVLNKINEYLRGLDGS
jgi:hypothetical protein